MAAITWCRGDDRNGLWLDRARPAPTLMLARDLFELPDTVGIEITMDPCLHPIGDDAYQQCPAKMFGSLLAHQLAPADPQGMEIEVGETIDLGGEGNRLRRRSRGFGESGT